MSNDYETVEADYVAVENLYFSKAVNDKPEFQSGEIQMAASGSVAPFGSEYKFNDFTPDSSGATVWTASDLYNTPHIFRNPSSSVNDTLPSATDLIAEMSNQSVGWAMKRKFTAGSENDITLVMGTGMTSQGNELTVYAGNSRDIYFVITSATTMDVYIV